MGLLNASRKVNEEVWPGAPHFRRSLSVPFPLAPACQVVVVVFPLLVLADADSGFLMLESCGANALVRSQRQAAHASATTAVRLILLLA